MKTRAWRPDPGIATLIVLAAIVLAWTLILSSVSAYLTQVAITSLINLMIVIGLYTFSGNSGVVSFGHVSFVAVGAYAAAILTMPAVSKAMLLPGLPGFLQGVHLGALPATAAAAVIACCFAALTGAPLMRLSGVAASIASFAVLTIVSVVLTNYQALSGIGGVLTAIPDTTGVPTSAAWAVAALCAGYAFQASRAGARLRASREDQFAARSLGIGIYRERLFAWVASAAITGAAGALDAQYLGALSATDFWLPLTFLTLAMLVTGGMHSLTGAVTGTLVITVLTEGLNQVETGIKIAGLTIGGRPGLANITLAIAMIVVLVRWPKGLTGGREITVPRPLRPRRSPRRENPAGPAPAIPRPSRSGHG
jgi:branched-chain amino acid transport system permease protein